MLFKHHRRPHRSGIRRIDFDHELPLSQLPPGMTARVVRVIGGHGLLNRIAALGFTPGAEVTLLQNFGHGPLIACVRGSRLALGRGEAARILVMAVET